MSDPTPDEVRFAGMLAKFTPEVAAWGADCVARLRVRMPTATVMVYDNYNALAIGFMPNHHPTPSSRSPSFRAGAPCASSRTDRACRTRKAC